MAGDQKNTIKGTSGWNVSLLQVPLLLLRLEGSQLRWLVYLVRGPHWGDTSVWEESLQQNYHTQERFCLSGEIWWDSLGGEECLVILMKLPTWISGWKIKKLLLMYPLCNCLLHHVAATQQLYSRGILCVCQPHGSTTAALNGSFWCVLKFGLINSCRLFDTVFLTHLHVIHTPFSYR